MQHLHCNVCMLFLELYYMYYIELYSDKNLLLKASLGRPRRGGESSCRGGEGTGRGGESQRCASFGRRLRGIFALSLIWTVQARLYRSRRPPRHPAGDSIRCVNMIFFNICQSFTVYPMTIRQMWQHGITFSSVLRK